MEDYITGTGQCIRVHDKDKCAGEYCCIHNPSDHHMKDWPTHWREDRKMMERICPHGVGHPDPDDLNFKIRQEKKKYNNPESDEAKIAIEEYIKYESIHGCDGCCNPKNRED